MVRRFALASACVTALMATANAADIYGAPEAAWGYKDSPFFAYNWTGFYIGAQAGSVWGPNIGILIQAQGSTPVSAA